MLNTCSDLIGSVIKSAKLYFIKPVVLTRPSFWLFGSYVSNSAMSRSGPQATPLWADLFNPLGKGTTLSGECQFMLMAKEKLIKLVQSDNGSDKMAASFHSSSHFALWVPVSVDSCCESQLETKMSHTNGMERWNDLDPLVMLHAKPQLVKNNWTGSFSITRKSPHRKISLCLRLLPHIWLSWGLYLARSFYKITAELSSVLTFTFRSL